jgi:hypothetical protein
VVLATNYVFVENKERVVHYKNMVKVDEKVSVGGFVLVVQVSFREVLHCCVGQRTMEQVVDGLGVVQASEASIG